MDEAPAVGFGSVGKSFPGFASGFIVRGGSHAAWIGGWLGGWAARWLRARKRASSELRALEVLGFGLRSCGGGELCNCRGRRERERVSE